MATNAVVPEQAGSISTQKQTYRFYVKTDTDTEGKTTITKKSSVAETDKKAPATLKDGTKNPSAGLSDNWAKLEAEGYTLLSENEFIKYSVKTVEAARLLVPDETQFVYIFQSGLNYLQNAKANGIMTALKEGTSEPEPLYNQLVIDLAKGVDEEGSYSINEAPTRRTLSDEDKLRKQLTAMGVPADKQEAVLAAMLAAMVTSEEETVTA